MNCIGVDFGWVSGASGLAWLAADAEGCVRFVEGARIRDVGDVVRWIADRAGADCVVAVDAPLRIGNAAGMRRAEREAHRLYGRFDAGCYPANQGSGFAARTTGFSRALAELGFLLEERPFREGRRQFECFPHIAAVEFFGLERILKYKKGPRAVRLAELTRLRELIAGRLGIADLRLPELPERGDLKDAEDRLDAVLCAYAAYWWWRWGTEKNAVLGDPGEGCMVVPRVRDNRQLEPQDHT